MPPKDAGSSCWETVCHFEAPRAKEASLIDFGTAFKLSLVATITMGKIKRASVKLPAKTLAPISMMRTKTSSPSSP